MKRLVLSIAAWLVLASSAWGAVSKEAGTFALNTGGSTTTVSTTFQAKAAVLWTDCKTATGESAGADAMTCFSEFERTAAGATGTVSVDFDTAVPVGWGAVLMAIKPVPLGASQTIVIN